MLKEVNYLHCGEKISWELFRTILNELRKREEVIEYAHYNPHIVQIKASDFFTIVRELEKKRELTHQHEDKGE